ncbi:P-loop ATPase, Sll1717 family [Bradyrhizobium sp. AUGA SZCCT0283]|uniref:P-loop ATPase, Sll1717 family n=1 Tax=Bradyrhizobium sp. AUGA SZCCT0283 TaxID=2807671 RepID=UPI001BAC4396|nr:hypothetical protein [Bradyrhizobium sp. AUGA SZCCT0283]MBR1277463.1 hypothetical protein [Bradyrhizobium sp. AUGA SZCCT0283]
MKKVDLLKQLTFGIQVAEDEIGELERYFVETHQWTRMEKGQIDIVRGEKGSGKSAIYSLLLSRTGQFFDNGILLIPAENPRGGTVFKDLSTEPPTTEQEFVALWKLYILTVIAQQIRDFGISGNGADRIYDILETAGLLETKLNLRSILRAAHDYARRIIAAESLEGGLKIDPNTLLPTGVTGKIVLREPSQDLRKVGIVSIDSLFSDLDDVLESNNLSVWVLLDRLDVAFVDNHDLEANALRALMRAYSDLKNTGRLALKIFLREDIWKRIMDGGMREASHLIRYVMLEWAEPTLLNLIMKRLLMNEALVEDFGLDVNAILGSAKAQEDTFYRFFPKQVDQGPQKASTFKWLVTRCADGTKKTAPRELIHLLNVILEQEIRRLENGGEAPLDDLLFDRSVFKLALPAVSNARLNQYLYAEYPTEKPFISKLEGQKTAQTPQSLADLWGISQDEALIKARRLVDLGFFEERGAREDPTFWTPFLYRNALNLIQGRAETDDDDG